MFSLIIAIVSIALIVAVTVLSGYYGGSTLSEAEAQAEAARLKNEEMQILAAMEAFNAQTGRYPLNIEELVDGRYLLSVPQGVLQVRLAPQPELIRSAFAQSATVGWSTPVAGQPIFATSMSVPHEVCRKYNLVSRGDDGILKQPFSSLPAQCYGSDANYRIVVTKTGAALSLPTAVAPSQVLHGGMPAKDTGDIWWETLPKGNIEAPVDEGKIRFAELQLLPTTAENFGDLQVNLTRTSAGRTVINNGNIAAESVGIQAPEGFNIANNSCTSGLAPGASCSFAVEFAPTQAKTYSGDVAVGSTNAGASRFPVEGVGHAASGELSSIAFGNQAAGSSSTRDATFRNTGVGPLNLGAVRVSGSGYALGAGGSCSGNLAAGATCTVRVTFSATGVDAPAGTVTVPSSEAGDISAALSAQSQEARLSVGPTARAFGALQVGQAVVSERHTVHNGGNIALTSLALTPPQGFTVVDSNCSSTLGAGASCGFSVRFAPAATTPYTGNVSLTSGNAVSTAVAVSGEGREQAASLSLASFGSVPAGSTIDQVATLTNTGVGPVSIVVPTAANVSGTGFAFVGTNCSATLAASQSCDTTIRYTATGQAAASGALTISTGAGNKVATLSGQSQQAVLGYDNSPRTFGNKQVGTSSTSAAHTVTNQGNVPMTNLVISALTGFSITDNTCPATLPAGGQCAFTITFTPGAVKAYAGDVQLSTSNAGNGVVAVSGTGVAQQATLTNLAFGSRNSGDAVVQSSTLKNTGLGPLSVTVPTAANVSGTGFSFVSTNCPASLPVGESCVTTVRYTPSGVAAASGSLNITTGAGVKVATLTGQSLQGYLTLSYPGQALGSTITWAAKVGTNEGKSAFTLTNNGNTAATGVWWSYPYGWYVFSNNCGSTLAVGASCSFQVRFLPNAVQTYDGFVDVYSDNSASAGAYRMTGIGMPR